MKEYIIKFITGFLFCVFHISILDFVSNKYLGTDVNNQIYLFAFLVCILLASIS